MSYPKIKISLQVKLIFNPYITESEIPKIFIFEVPSIITGLCIERRELSTDAIQILSKKLLIS